MKTLSGTALNPPVGDTKTCGNRICPNLSIHNSREVLNMTQSAEELEATSKHFRADGASEYL